MTSRDSFRTSSSSAQLSLDLLLLSAPLYQLRHFSLTARHCHRIDLLQFVSLTASVALQTKSTVVTMEAVVSIAPATSAALSPCPTKHASSTSSNDDDDVGRYIAAPSTTPPTQSSPPRTSSLQPSFLVLCRQRGR